MRITVILITLSVFFFFSSQNQLLANCAAGYDCSKRGVGEPGSQCSAAEWENKLVGQESGGSYTIQAPNSSAAGRYQFIDGTRKTIGSKYNLPCSGSGQKAAFAACPGLQDDYFRALVQENKSILQNSCSQHCGKSYNGVEVTMSGLLAMAHNVGPGCAKEWAAGGEGNLKTVVAPGQPPCRDANGTNAVQKYAAAMGGFDVGSGASDNCGFGYTAGDPNATPYQGHLIGCDPEVLEEGQKIVDALNEAQIEAAKAIITKPNPLGVTGCEDQHHNIIENIMSGFSNIGGGNQSLVQNVKQPHAQHTGQFFGPQNIAGTMTSALQKAFVGTFGQAGQNMLNTANNVNNTINNFASSLGGIFGGGGGSASKDCGLQEDAWLIAQCIEMPQIPSLSNILGGKIAEIQGAIQGVADLANPERLLQKVCGAANDKVKGLFGAATDKFKDAADAVTTPITDSAASLTN